MNQLAMELPAARSSRDRGITESRDHAESVESGWGESAYRVLADYARASAGEWTSEDFRAHLNAIGFPVPVPKALGAVFQRAARVGLIRRVGFGISKQRHLSPCPLWTRA